MAKLINNNVPQMQQNAQAEELIPNPQNLTQMPKNELEMAQNGILAREIIKVDSETLAKANEILKKYKEGKSKLEERLISDEQWWKMRHWEGEIDSQSNNDDPKPASGWLFNCIISKHADAMEAYPTFNCLPREQGDKEEAERLTSILPVVLEQNGFEETYSDVAWQKLKGGTGVYKVVWDKDKLNGLGDISINKVDILNLFWQPGITDIQKSKHVFHTELVDNDILEQRYPSVVGKLGGKELNISHYLYDDNVDTTDKSVVIDWYYHTEYNGKKVLHYCKYVNTTVLFATENEAEFAEKGLYDHCRYPFVFDSLFPVEGTPCGFGYIDVCREPQKYIDILNQAIIKNALWNASPRYFARTDAGINEEELMDITKPIIHCNNQLDDSNFRPIATNTLNDIYVSIMNNKIEELKETSGNRDVNNGGSTSGVTAASAIAAMQEQSGKTSRDSSLTSYRSYKRIIEMCIELVRQFYELPRQFRITGQYGMDEYVKYTNAALQPQSQGEAFGQQMGYRIPVFDLEISAQKSSPYSKLSQNELALQFYNAGFFNPQLADQVLGCLNMMDFNHKSDIEQKITEGNTLYKQNAQLKQQMLQMAQMIDQTQGSNLAQQMANQFMSDGGVQMPQNINTDITETTGNGELKQKNTIVDKAKERANQATQPA